MGIQSLFPVSLLLATVFLAHKVFAWIFVMLKGKKIWVPGHWHTRRLVQADQQDHVVNVTTNWPAVAAWLLGAIGMIALSSRVGTPAWLLPVLLAAMIGSEELQPPYRQSMLPDVVVFISIFRAALSNGYPLFDALVQAGNALNDGELKTALDEVMMRHRRRLSMGKCLQPLRACHTYLAELVICMEAAGWQANKLPPLQILTLQRKVEREWDSCITTIAFLNRIQPAGKLLQVVFLGGMTGALVVNAAGFFVIPIVTWTATWVPITLAAALATLTFTLSRRFVWLRRSLVVAVLLLAAVSILAGDGRAIAFQVFPALW